MHRSDSILSSFLPCFVTKFLIRMVDFVTTKKFCALGNGKIYPTFYASPVLRFISLPRSTASMFIPSTSTISTTPVAAASSA